MYRYRHFGHCFNAFVCITVYVFPYIILFIKLLYQSFFPTKKLSHNIVRELYPLKKSIW